MCVIFYADEERPLPAQIKAGFDQNPQGAGIAWREGGIVHWKKGLDLPQIQKECKTRPIPYAVHFRVASMQQQKAPLLCHPYPITEEVELALEGETRGAVLMHNGSWTAWRHELRQAAYASRIKLPSNTWIDTRGLAWMAHHFGLGMLELIDERVLVFGPTEVELFGSTWTRAEISKGKSMIVSNRAWMEETKAVTVYRGGGHHSYANPYGWSHTHDEHAGDDYYLTPPASLPGGQARGPVLETPFRGTTEVEAAAGIAADQQGRVQAAAAGGAEDGGGTPSGGSAAESSGGGEGSLGPGADPVMQRVWDWACGLNPKKPHVRLKAVTDDDRAKRAELLRRGIEIIGPM